MDKKGHYLALILLEALEDENMNACKQLLVTFKANPNIIVTERGFAPIHYASGMENVNFAEEIMRLMLELGGDPNVRSEEKLTPLHVAAIWGRKNIVQMLLEKGGDINAVDDEDKTPILYAIHECHYDVVKVIQNFIFEKKIEEKKKRLLINNNDNKLTPSKLKNPCNILENNNLSVIKNLEEKKFTPNRINYNFDITSPYYINITHRRKPNQKFKFPEQNQNQYDQQEEKEHEVQEIINNTSLLTEETENQINEVKLLKQYHHHIPENLFELTEDNLTEYAKFMSPEYSKISFIKAWRDKVQKAKSKKSILNYFHDIDSLLNGITNNNTIDFTNTQFVNDNDAKDLILENSLYSPNKKLFNFTKFGKLMNKLQNVDNGVNNNNGFKDNNYDEEEETFLTAKNHESPSSSTNHNNKQQQQYQQQNLQIPENQTNNFQIRSPNRNEYVIQTAEEYVHTDEENGLIFYEKRLIINDTTATGGYLNKTQTSISTDFTVPLDYDSEDLRRELTNFGDPPGPITKSTKKLYMKRLIKYKRNPEKMALLREKQQNLNEKNYRPNFSVELEKTIRNIEWFKRISDHMGLEAEMNEYFKNLTNDKKHLRDGHLKTSFIYLLIDPRISDNLPAQSLYMDKHDIWKKFLNSIFYVGKGKSIRPYQHLYDAMKIFSRFYEKQTKEIIEKVTIYGGQKIPKSIPLDKLRDNKELKDITDSKKIERILDIWKSKNGVICLHVFHNILPIEALTREASIIDAIGLEHLTNIKRGEYYGITKTWSMRQRKNLGIALLYKSLQIFLVEGESQLLPSDLV